MIDSMEHSKEAVASLADSELVARASQGDAAAFELIVRRHNQILFRAAISILKDETLAQDAVQDSYLNVFTHLDSYKGQASLKTWLTRIVINRAISMGRKHVSKTSMNENVTFLHGNELDGDTMTSQIAGGRTPEAVLNQQEIKQFLENAIQQLPEIYRCVFILRDVESMSVAETAYCLELNEALIKKRLSRARKILRENLLQQLGVQNAEVFEFAGRRCDTVTSYVMAELRGKGIIS